jgi:glycosyltransferase involved in cell wall biosynthesis
MLKTKYPTITVVIPTFNEEKNLKRLLPSIKKQTYPKSKIEYLLIDDGSTDTTLKLAKKYGLKIVKVNTHDVELNKGTGMYLGKGELVYWVDGDMEIISRDFFQLMVEPLMKNKNVIASFTKEFAIETIKTKSGNSVNRYLSYHPLQQDQLYVYLTKRIEDTIVSKKDDYYICKFVSGKIPAVGRLMYRKARLLKTDAKKFKHFFDLDSTEMCVKAGYDQFAYVPKAKINHYHTTSFTHLVKKRMRNLHGDYLKHFSIKYYLWIDPKSPKDTIRLILWVVYANLVLPELFFAIVESVKHRDICFMWRPLVTLFVTDALILSFISTASGRKFLIDRLSNITNSS